MARATGRGSDQFNLRFPEGMRERIAYEADKSGRSMNAEIIARLSFTLDGNLSDRQELSATIDRYQKMIIEYGSQIAQLITMKNSYKLIANQNDATMRQQAAFLESICHLIVEDPSVSDHLRNFAVKTLESIEFQEVEGGPKFSTDLMTDTEKEVREVIRDVEENAEERAKNNPWIQAVGNNGFFTTVDISQRDSKIIPDAPTTEKSKKPKKP
ncbi:Arc family DNA-binding protein [Brucella rhizosphaerae]|uniref:Arc family DNA-binding protein n=1 Tax=Brucella rhizosphaerae TaxID=571254 RepID=UPI00046787AF|nr:Arc family DNA-binding protein [Brucella rhizosphaerae]